MDWNEENFLKVYKGSEKFVTIEREYYNLFLDLLKNEELLAHIRFANDVLGVPPLKTFITYERDYMKKDVFNKNMSAVAKRGLGACFGYLYKVIYGGYDSEQCWVNDCDKNNPLSKTGIVTASCFKEIK